MRSMNYSQALTMLKQGHVVARSGWNGKGMWLIYISALDWSIQPQFEGTALANANVESLERLPWIAMRTADRKLVPWLASQTDMLANDWEIVKDPS